MNSETSTPQPGERRVQKLFALAAGLNPAEAESFLDRECADDIALRRELEGLLAAHHGSTDPILERVGAVSPWDGEMDFKTTVTPHTGACPTSLHPSRAATLPHNGARIGQYELIRELGQGGMSKVYLARDTKLGRKVAIKFLLPSQATLAERFLVEAQATARCTHENIVVIHDIKDYRDTPYMVLEYLEGQDLGSLVSQGPVAPYRAVQLLLPVARALVCAHEQGIVHRDLKPDNIFLTHSGAIKVLDFGIAKFVIGERQRELVEHVSRVVDDTITDLPILNHLTNYGDLIGTIPFMSPEQWGSDEIDHRTDLWTMGIILYCMVVGRHPLHPARGEQFMITGLLDHPMPSARDAGVAMPRRMADLIDHCLQKSKDQRIPSAAHLLAELEKLQPGSAGRELEVDESPYAGLGAFQEDDANRFFGRAREIATALAWLHDRPLIGIVGPSGVGKSSFVRAGVIPALKQSGDPWEAMVIRPGRHPTAALANILSPMLTSDDAAIADHVAQHQAVIQRLHREPGFLGTVLRSRAAKRKQKILLFVDQCEELFTLNPDIQERLAFMACLAGMADDALSPLRVVLSIRSDFLDRVAEDPDFMADLSPNLLFLRPPDRDSLRDALTQPAEQANYRFETRAMVEHMLETLESTSGALPLLQFAATKLWEARDTEQNLLTEQSYRAIGGAIGALASHADAVLASLPADTQGLMRTLFLRLVTPERTRAIASLAELRELTARPGEVERLIDQLVDARLLVTQSSDSTDGATVEIVHEALIDGWPQLRLWLEESHDDQAYLEQLRVAARQWDSRGRSGGLLWRGEIARDAMHWRRRYRGALSRTQRDFLDAVASLVTRTARLQRFCVVGAIVFLSLLVVAASIALVKIREAEKAARESERVAWLAVQDAEDQAEFAWRAEKKAEKQAELAELARRELHDNATAMHEQGKKILILLSEIDALGSKYNDLRRKFQAAIRSWKEIKDTPPDVLAKRQRDKLWNRLTMVKREREAARKAARRARAEVVRAEGRQAVLVEEKVALAGEVEQLSRAIDEGRLRSESAEKQMTEAKRRIAALTRKITRLERLSVADCPVCPLP